VIPCVEAVSAIFHDGMSMSFAAQSSVHVLSMLSHSNAWLWSAIVRVDATGFNSAYPAFWPMAVAKCRVLFGHDGPR